MFEGGSDSRQWGRQGKVRREEAEDRRASELKVAGIAHESEGERVRPG